MIIIIGSNAIQYIIIAAIPMNFKFPYEENQQKAMQSILSWWDDNLVQNFWLRILQYTLAKDISWKYLL